MKMLAADDNPPHGRADHRPLRAVGLLAVDDNLPHSEQLDCSWWMTIHRTASSWIARGG